MTSSHSPIKTDDVASLAEIAALAVGAQVTRVWYQNVAVEPPPVQSDLDEIDLAVQIDLTPTQTVVISWAMEGLVEGLSVRSDDLKKSAPAPIDVSHTTKWRNLIGATIHEVGTAWQETNEGTPSTLWAIRFSLDNDAVTIALGVAADGGVSYLPDGLVALFGRDSASSYTPPASKESAYGSPINRSQV